MPESGAFVNRDLQDLEKVGQLKEERVEVWIRPSRMEEVSRRLRHGIRNHRPEALSLRKVILCG